MNNTLTVIIKNKEGIIFSGQVRSVSSYNEIGPFDILPEHEHFVAVITKTLTLITQEGVNHSIPLVRGLMRVKNNKVNVYLGI